MSASQMFSSCATLEDGRTHIEQNASEVEDEEALLMKELEDIDAKIAREIVQEPETVPATTQEIQDATSGNGTNGNPHEEVEPTEYVEEPKPIQEPGHLPVPTPTRALAKEVPAPSLAPVPAESQAPKTPELQELPQPGQSSPPKTENTKVEGESAGGAPPEPSITPAIDNNGKPSGSKGSDKEDDLEPKTRKVKLRNAARGRLMRMIKDKSVRKSLDAPEWLKQEWHNGDKNAIAELLVQSNFNKEVFKNRMETIVTSRKQVEMIVDEGFYTESEMRDDLGWSQSKVDGAKKRCEALGESYYRCNQYDGLKEYWIVVKESGRRTESQAHEKKHIKEEKADGEPKFDFAESSFKGLDGLKLRDQVQTTTVQANPSMDKYAQTKESLRTFLQSLMSKCGKLRQCVKEIKGKYVDDASSVAVAELQKHIKTLDTQYDACNDAWATGEADKFTGEKFYNDAENVMRKATFECSKAAAAEMKVRNQKKYWTKNEKNEKNDKEEKPKKTKKRPNPEESEAKGNAAKKRKSDKKTTETEKNNEAETAAEKKKPKKEKKQK